eukprot:1793348-Rhodomonas_salina.1
MAGLLLSSANAVFPWGSIEFKIFNTKRLCAPRSCARQKVVSADALGWTVEQVRASSTGNRTPVSR